MYMYMYFSKGLTQEQLYYVYMNNHLYMYVYNMQNTTAHKRKKKPGTKRRHAWAHHNIKLIYTP